MFSSNTLLSLDFMTIKCNRFNNAFKEEEKQCVKILMTKKSLNGSLSIILVFFLNSSKLVRFRILMVYMLSFNFEIKIQKYYCRYIILYNTTLRYRGM